MSPLNYLVKSGCATLSEVAELKRKDPASIERLKEMARVEMAELGIAIKE